MEKIKKIKSKETKNEETKNKKTMTGFSYYVDDKVIEEYRKKPLELRIKWLYYMNKLRKYYPKDIIEKQEKFRKGEI